MRKHFPFTPLKKKRLYEEVAEQIKQPIFTGQLEPGDRLPSERDLCKLFKVGRPTVSESLRTLSLM
ncbi:MAG: FadR family transcriptional regulator [Deltaproteobacteria bacterium]|nr:FadR family transcriptional regulator [Deltaproteobacteria bacterium]MBW2077752.1 FadR family transcriptional regulator [Deltaproteobacteria bacterium]